MEIENENSIPQSAEEAEALVNSWDEPQEASEPNEGDLGETPDGNAPPPPAEANHNLNYKGKEESYPLSKIIEFAQQGRDYSQKMHDLSVQRTQLENHVRQVQAENAKVAERIKQYAEVEAYQQKDPAWWKHVVDSYQARQGSNQDGSPSVQLPPEIASKIETLEQFVQAQQQEKVVQAQSAEDTELDGVIKGYRDEFASFDWSTKDAQGRDLERQILDHAIALGITKPSGFRAAANDYLFKQHVERAKTNGKVDVGKQIQKTTKLGLGPVTPHSSKQIERAKNVSSKSYEELTAEAIEKYGLR